MSRSWSHTHTFSCWNGCGDSGAACEHRMRIVYVHTSDHVIVEIDPKEGDRPGNAEWSHSFDQGAFSCLIGLIKEENNLVQG